MTKENCESQNGEKTVHVNGYVTKKGKDVDDYYRSKPNSNKLFEFQVSKNVIKNNLTKPLYNAYKNLEDLGDKTQEKIYVEGGGYIKDKYGKTSTTFLNNAMNDFEDARNDKNATVYESGNSIPDAGLRKFITEDTSITNGGKIDVKNMRGAYYNSNSDVANSIAHDRAIREYVKDNYANLIYNGEKIEEYRNKVPKEMQPWFKSTYVAKANLELSDKTNKWDIAHCTLYNPHIDNNGHFKTQVIDIVDYEKRTYYDGYYYANIPNNWGYKMQQAGKLENVFHIVDIDIPMSELDNKK